MPFCDYCRQTIPQKTHPYTLKLELYPAVEPSLTIKEEELKRDLQAEMERLIEMMAGMDDAEVIRQEKLIHVAHTFTLCPACRDLLAERLSRLSPPPM